MYDTYLTDEAIRMIKGNRADERAIETRKGMIERRTKALQEHFDQFGTKIDLIRVCEETGEYPLKWFVEEGSVDRYSQFYTQQMIQSIINHNADMLVLRRLKKRGVSDHMEKTMRNRARSALQRLDVCGHLIDLAEVENKTGIKNVWAFWEAEK